MTGSRWKATSRRELRKSWSQLLRAQESPNSATVGKHLYNSQPQFLS